MSMLSDAERILAAGRRACHCGRVRRFKQSDMQEKQRLTLWAEVGANLGDQHPCGEMPRHERQFCVRTPERVSE